MDNGDLMFTNLKEIQKLATIINSIITTLVLVMMVIYYLIGATFLVYYSVFVAIVYFIHYPLIRRFQFVKVTWSTYTMLTLYMFICTIFLGYDYGFQLYSMSTIPLIYYIKYLTTKYGGENPRPNFWAVVIVISCLTSSLYSVKCGPIYPTEGLPALTFLGLNLLSVCFFLITFAQFTTKIIIDSENKLKNQANFDALTGIANRYLMTSNLEQLIADPEQANNLWIAMLDIDDFKKINDRFGHTNGDRVLSKLAAIMKKTCKDCIVSRWGGEEFLICGNTSKVSIHILDQLVKDVEAASLSTHKDKIKFTISVGASVFHVGQSIDSWIISADKKLYHGKNNGKNRVTY